MRMGAGHLLHGKCSMAALRVQQREGVLFRAGLMPYALRARLLGVNSGEALSRSSGGRFPCASNSAGFSFRRGGLLIYPPVAFIRRCYWCSLSAGGRSLDSPLLI